MQIGFNYKSDFWWTIIQYWIHFYLYTLYLDSTSLVAVVHPASKSTALETIGRLRTTDNPGICLPTNKTVGKKFPNKFRNPKPSNINPTNPHLIVTKMIPIKNVIVPLKRSILIHKAKWFQFQTTWQALLPSK